VDRRCRARPIGAASSTAAAAASVVLVDQRLEVVQSRRDLAALLNRRQCWREAFRSFALRATMVIDTHG
jgi:hypothetical protein